MIVCPLFPTIRYREFSTEWKAQTLGPRPVGLGVFLDRIYVQKTIIINRCRKEDTYEVRLKEGRLPESMGVRR